MAILGNVIGMFSAPLAIASATTTNLPAGHFNFSISGSATITSLLMDIAPVGVRYVRFEGAASAAVVFTNTNDATALGTMDLGGSNITLGDRDVLVLRQTSAGAWVREYTTNN